MSKLHDVIMELGGYGKFCALMGPHHNNTGMREIASGDRIPTAMMRKRIVEAAGGRITEQDIIDISGREIARQDYSDRGVNPNWNLPEDERRYWIWQTASDGARKQRILNRRRG